jgi:hypothetical protein
MSSYGAKGTRTPDNRLQRTAAEPERSLAWRRAAMAELLTSSNPVACLGKANPAGIFLDDYVEFRSAVRLDSEGGNSARPKTGGKILITDGQHEED